MIQIFQDWKYDGWTSEEVYDEIHKKAEENGKKFLEQLGELLDEHVDWEKASKGQKGSKGKGKGKGQRPTYTKEELGKIRDEIQRKHDSRGTGGRCR